MTTSAFGSAPTKTPVGDHCDLAPGTQVGDYVVEGKIADGGMASIYAGMHPVIGRRVAIKIIAPYLSLRPDTLQRFAQEAWAVNQIRHPNIVDVYTYGALPDGRPYFVMEWLPGETLAALGGAGMLSRAELLRVAVQVCDALGAAHAAGVVHRDLKPENVLLVPDPAGWKVKLLDFGIAKLQRPPEAFAATTRVGLTLGTPQYCSPEQARGRAVDHRADIYSLGVVLYEQLTGFLPFEADNYADVLAMHLYDPPPPPEVEPALATLLLGMLDKEAARRPSLAEVRAQLLALVDAPVVATAAPTPAPAPAPAKLRPRRAPLVAVALVLAAGLAAALVASTGERVEPVAPPVVAEPAPPPATRPTAPEPAVAPPRPPAPEAPPVERPPVKRPPRRAAPPSPPRDGDAADYRIVDPFAPERRRR
jgi:serine/threonine-protein kinase